MSTTASAQGVVRDGYTPDGPDPKKEVAREIIIAIARAMADNGIMEFDRGQWVINGGIAGCCEAWNRLLNAVATGGNLLDEANAVLSSCEAVG